jgi:hypothetical protein
VEGEEDRLEPRCDFDVVGLLVGRIAVVGFLVHDSGVLVLVLVLLFHQVRAVLSYA